MGAATGMSTALSARLQPQPPTQQSRVALWVQPDYGPEINVGDVPYYDGRGCPGSFWAKINELWYMWLHPSSVSGTTWTRISA